MSRWKASGIHVVICTVVAAAVLSVMWFVWYPYPYFRAVGGDELLLLILAVDIVLGPLITLVIFDTAKKSLRFDLVVVAILQLTALAYGIHVMFIARPVFNVFSVNRFDVVSANEIDDHLLNRASRPEFRTLPLFGPRLVAAQMPAEQQAKEEIMFSSLSGIDLQHYPQYYVPYAQQIPRVIAASRPISELIKRNPSLRTTLKVLGEAEAANLRFVPMRAKKRDLTVLVDASGRFVGMVPVDPWK